MLSSPATTEAINNSYNYTSLNGLSSSSSSSSFSSSKSSSTTNSRPSSSPSPPHLSPETLTPPSPRTMEEVWKDIALSSLHSHHNHLHASSANPNFRGTILQDFLARPFNEDPSSTTLTSSSSSSTDNSTCSLFGSASSSSSLPPPLTFLSLNSGPEFHFLHDPTTPLGSNAHTTTNNHNRIISGSRLPSHSDVGCFGSPFETLANDSALIGGGGGLGAFGKKRQVCESGGVNETNGSCDRRHKRMIKNRESAARSRARKQAYTNELELEVAHLLEENARLKKQQDQLWKAAASQLPKKHSLQRTSTAPF